MESDQNTLQFRPLLIQTLRLFFRRWKLFLPIGLIFYIPMTFINNTMYDKLNVLYDNLMQTVQGNFAGQSSGLGDYSPVLLLSAANVLLLPILAAATAGIVNNALNGKPVTAQSVLDASVNRFLRIDWTSLLYNALVFAGMVLVIPGILFFVNYNLCVYSAALTEKSGFSALGESRRLVRGRWFRTAAYLLILELILVAVSVILMAAFDATGITQNGIVSFLLSAIVNTIGIVKFIFFSLYYIGLKKAAERQQSIDITA